MNSKTKISPKHPRAESLRIRRKLLDHFGSGVVAEAGLFAHGRGEAFDYLLGERTTEVAFKALEAAAALLLSAKHPVISVNGNAAALVANDIVQLAEIVGARIEVNLYYRSLNRELAIQRLLEAAGANHVLGVAGDASMTLPEMQSERRRVDPQGIGTADVVLIPLEDGDRTEVLVKSGKKVIAIDLNPLSRTARFATMTIVDNIVRAMPTLVERARELRNQDQTILDHIIANFANSRNLADTLTLINQRLSQLAEHANLQSL
jgi:4-phosphopantoate--beta-alanine ligase